VHGALCTYIWLAARDGPISVVTDRGLHCYTGHTIVASPLYSPLALEILLGSLLESLLGSLFGSLLGSLLDSLLDSLLGSRLERAAFESRASEEVELPAESLGRWNTLSLWQLWLIEGSKSVKALTLTLT
jgi:hypothetical protein